MEHVADQLGLRLDRVEGFLDAVELAAQARVPAGQDPTQGRPRILVVVQLTPDRVEPAFGFGEGHRDVRIVRLAGLLGSNPRLQHAAALDEPVVDAHLRASSGREGRRRKGGG